LTLVRRFSYGFSLVFALALLVVAFNYITVLTAAGSYLVESRAPEKADAILVLAGDYRGKRILKAAELVRDGFAPIAFVSGPAEMYGINEAALAVQFATRNGIPPSYFEPIQIQAHSTLEEAHAFAPLLRQRRVRRVLLVTSNYHTRRAAAIFRKVLGSDADVRAVAAPDPYFQPDSWWHNREGQKIVFYEYSKAIAGWLGM
jgi:uncharacterized SAM-binding protein YcdF (DUF218 family)